RWFALGPKAQSKVSTLFSALPGISRGTAPCLAMLPVTHGLKYCQRRAYGHGVTLPLWQCDLAMWQSDFCYLSGRTAIWGLSPDRIGIPARLCPKKGVWNFQALEISALIGLGEFQTPFFGQNRRVRFCHICMV